MTDFQHSTPVLAPHRNWVRVVSVTLFVIGATFYGTRCVRNGRWSNPLQSATAKGGHGSDFTAFYSAGEQARQQRNIYDFKSSSTPYRPFIYPPLFALFPMAPLSLLSHDTAYAVFYALGMIQVFLTLWILLHWLWPPKQRAALPFLRSADLGLFLAVAICWRFFHANCNDGNANFFVLFPLALGLHFILRAQRAGARAEFLGGISIGLATVIKLTPGLFGLYFLWSRKLWALIGGALGILLFLIVLPSLWLGWQKNYDYVEAFTVIFTRKALGQASDPGANTWKGITVGTTREGDAAKTDNAVGLGVSLRGALNAVLRPTPVLKKPINGKRTVNVVTLSSAQAKIFVNVLTLALLLATIALTFSKRAQTGIFPAGLSWGLVAITMALISPMTRPAHLVVLLIPVAALIALLQQERLSGWASKLAWSALLLMGIGQVVVSRDVVGERMNDTLNAMGFTTLVMLVLYVAVAAALLQTSRESKS